MSGVLIAGGAGRLGRALARALSARGVVVLALSREEADAASVEALLAAGEALLELIRRFKGRSNKEIAAFTGQITALIDCFQ